MIGDLNPKVENPEVPGVTGKFGLGAQNKAGHRLMEFCQEDAGVTAHPLFHNMDSTHEHH